MIYNIHLLINNNNCIHHSTDKVYFGVFKMKQFIGLHLVCVAVRIVIFISPVIISPDSEPFRKTQELRPIYDLMFSASQTSGVCAGGITCESGREAVSDWDSALPHPPIIPFHPSIHCSFPSSLALTLSQSPHPLPS